MQSKISHEDISVKIDLINKPEILARATVILLNCFEIHGWKIMPSRHMNPLFNEDIWIQPPSVEIKKIHKWYEIVFINDKGTYEFVQSKIHDAYFMAKQKDMNYKDLLSKEFDPDKVAEEVENANL